MGAQCHLFHGDDAYAIREARRRLESSLLDPTWRDFNLQVLPPEAPGRMLVEALLAVPVGAGNRLVVQAEPAWLAAGKEDPSLEELIALLTRGLPARSHLLLCATKLDSRLKGVKALTPLVRVQAFQVPKPWEVEEQLGPWLEGQAEALGVRVSAEAASYLLKAAGEDRFRLKGELEKLATYVGPGGVLDMGAIRDLASAGEAEIFALTQAIARREPAAALLALQHLLASENPVKILAATSTIMRQWLRLKQLAEMPMPPFQIAQALGHRGDFKVRKDLAMLSGWKASELARALDQLRAYEFGLKSGGWSGEGLRLGFELTLARLLGPPGGRRRPT